MLNGGQIGFGLCNNWVAFGGGPDLGFLPPNGYHLFGIERKKKKTLISSGSGDELSKGQETSVTPVWSVHA